MSNANIQSSLALRMDSTGSPQVPAWSINCILLYVSCYAANRNLLTVADSLTAQYLEYLLLMRVIIIIHMIRRTPRTETYDDSGNMVQRDDEIFKYDSENKLTQVDKTVGDTVHYLYEHTGNRIRKSRTGTNEVVYNINGVYEVTKIPSMSDRHTLYIRGIKEELVAQYTASDVALLTDSNPTNENKAGIALLISSFKNKLDQTRIEFAKWVTRTQANNPFALKLYTVYAILFCILLYGEFLLGKELIIEHLDSARYKLRRNVANGIDLNLTGLRLVSLLLIVSVSFAFSNCSPNALTGGNRPQTPPYWLFAAFSSEPESTSVSTDNSNNPASSGGNSPVTTSTPPPSSGGGTIIVTTPSSGSSTPPPSSGGNGQTGSSSIGSGSGTLSAGTPRLGMFFFHPDHTGSISMVTDGAGRMMTDTSGASQLTYKPYGEVNRMNSYGPDIFRYKYTSQQDDQETGLYYYNARYYDPVLGSFTSAASAFGLNHYMYTEGNPVRYGDASGNFLVPLLMAAMAYVAIAVIVVATYVAFAFVAGVLYGLVTNPSAFLNKPLRAIMSYGYGGVDVGLGVLFNPMQGKPIPVVKSYGKKGAVISNSFFANQGDDFAFNSGYVTHLRTEASRATLLHELGHTSETSTRSRLWNRTNYGPGDEVETDLKQGTLGYWQTHLLLGYIAYKNPEFRPVYDLIYGYNLANDNLNESFLSTWAIDYWLSRNL